MSDGKSHEKAGIIISLGIAGAGMVMSLPPLLAVAAGGVIGTLFLSPDLDMKHTRPAQRWGILNPLIWGLYRKDVGHHRSYESHSPIFSSLKRVSYLLAVLAIVSIPAWFLWQQIPIWTLLVWCWNNKLTTLGFLVGLEIATDIHLVQDTMYSANKKRHKQHNHKTKKRR